MQNSWKSNKMLRVEDQIIKLSEVAEITKLTSLVKEKAIHFF